VYDMYHWDQPDPAAGSGTERPGRTGPSGPAGPGGGTGPTGPAAHAVQVVILKAQKELSRTYYATGYVEGVNNPPDCWSSDGVRPDETVANPVNPVCATCPCDAWGSGATPAAPKAKACQQRRRTVNPVARQ